MIRMYTNKNGSDIPVDKYDFGLVGEAVDLSICGPDEMIDFSAHDDGLTIKGRSYSEDFEIFLDSHRLKLLKEFMRTL